MATMRKVLLVGLFFACVGAGKAQVVSFIVDTSGGVCVPATVSFTMQGSMLYDMLTWDFGTGQGDQPGGSTAQYYYNTPGTYTIRLAVYYGGKPTPSAATATITIHDVPHFSFSADKDTICPGEKVNFTTNLISPTTAADIVSYDWTFSDGGRDTAKNASYTYQNSSNIDLIAYTPSLLLASKHGCQSRVDVNSMIHVRRKPVIDFSVDSNIFCVENSMQTGSVKFTNKTDANIIPPLTNANTYVWKFGDGDSSTLQNPSHAYGIGSHSVTLTATSPYGCVANRTLPSIVQVIYFKVSTIPSDTVVLCEIPAPFTIIGGNPDPAIQYYFNFGNFTEGYRTPASTTYTAEGAYIIAVRGTHPAGCVSYDTVTVLAYNKVSAKNIITDTNMCNPNEAVIFQNAAKYNSNHFVDLGLGKTEWFFGQGNSYAVGDSVQHAYGVFGDYIVRQVVTTPYGCVLDTVEQPIHIFSLHAAGTYFLPNPMSPPAGCAPLDVGVMNIFDSLKTSSPITDYIWSWGDNSTDSTGSTMLGTHTYQDTGVFDVDLTLINQQGCQTTVPITKFSVGVEPFSDFNYIFTQDCRSSFSLQVFAYDKNPYGAVKANQWTWWDANNPISPIATGETAFLNFSENIGYQGAILVPYHNGCAGQAVFKDSVGYLCPPIAKIDYPKKESDETLPVFCQYPCFGFADGSVGAMTTEWYMGDTVNGLTVSADKKEVLGTPPANFDGQTKLGPIYWLRTWNTGQDSIHGAIPAFCYKPADSLRQDSNFYLLKNGGVVLITLKACNWDTTSNEYLSNGEPHPTYNRCKYCEDTATQVILISDAMMNFVADKYDVCQGSGVHFFDSTFCTVPLTTWGFSTLYAKDPSNADYPVGHFVPMSNPRPSPQQGQWLNFNKPNQYLFVLSDTCAFGCVRTDTVEVNVYPRSIPAWTSSTTANGTFAYQKEKDKLCLNKPDTLYLKDNSKTAYPFDTLKITNWVWKIDNSGLDSLIGSEISLVPVTYGLASMRLTVTNEKGCDSTTTYDVGSNYFRADYIDARWATQRKTYCNKTNIYFNNQSSVLPQTYHQSNGTRVVYEWDYGDGSPVEIHAPFTMKAGQTPPAGLHQYDFPNKQTKVAVTLTVWMVDNPSCKEVYIDTLTIIRPIANFTDNGHIFPCPGNTGIMIQFKDSTQSDAAISYYTWNFGDGDKNEGSTLTNPAHLYQVAGVYDVMLIVQDEVGCVDTMFKPKWVNIDGPAGTFTYSPLSGCVPLSPVNFEPNIIRKPYSGEYTADTVIWFPDGITPEKVGGYNVNNLYRYRFDNAGAYIPLMQMIKWVDNNGKKERCEVTVMGMDTIWVIDLKPDFIADSLYGLDKLVEFINTTTVNPSVLRADSTYWDYGNGNFQWIYNVNTQLHNGLTTYEQEGAYTITMTEYYKTCHQSKSLNIGVKVGVGIVETHCNASLRVYPNPTTGQLTIDCRDVINHVSTVEIYDVVGQRVLAPLTPLRGEQSPFEGGRGMSSSPANPPLEWGLRGATIDISHLSAGMYFLKIGNKTARFVKE